MVVLAVLTKNCHCWHILVADIWLDKQNLLPLQWFCNIIAVAEKFHAEGGRFGSQTNLMGDAAETMGKKVGNFIEKQIKNSTK